MLHLVSKPHRDTLRADTPDVQKLFVLLKVIPAAPLASLRPPLALALVIDTSGSMRDPSARNTSGRSLSGRSLSGRGDSKLEHALRATEAVIENEQLVAGDLLSIIQFDDVARVVLPLSPLGDGQSARAALQKLANYSGGTQIAQGLLAAHSELGRILQGGVAQRVLLLTDGQAFDAAACHQAAAQLAEANVPLVSIGVGDDYNEELLRDLAEAGRGRPYHLDEMDRLEEVFGWEVQTSVREVVTALQAQVQLVAGVHLDSVTRVYPDLAEMNLGATASSGGATSVSLGNIMAGDYTVFVLELTVSGRARTSGRARLAQLQLTGKISTGDGHVESARHDLVVSFAGETSATPSVDDEVLGYVEQRNVDRLVQSAVARAGHDLPGAKQSLQSALEMTRRIGNVRVTQLLQRSLDELGAGGLSSSTRKTIALQTRTRTIKTVAVSERHEAPDDEEIRRLTGA